MRIRITLTSLLSIFFLFSYGQSDQVILYMQTGTPNSVVDAIALENNNAAVITYPAVGGNIAVIQPSYPYANPYPGGGIVVDADAASIIIPDGRAEADGGSENFPISNPSDTKVGGNGKSCYSQGTIQAPNGPWTRDILIVDTGLEYEITAQNGFIFQNVTEINGPVSDNFGHGTHVSTVINGVIDESPTALSNTNYLIANPLSSGGSGMLAEILLDIEDALLNYNIDVVNCSWSYNNYIAQMNYDPMYHMINSALAANTLFVVSAGNNSVNLEAQTNITKYPVSFPSENILSVASYSCENSISDFSNFGIQSVDIAAPGEGIRGLDEKGEMAYYSGTSQATAFVSAAAVKVGSRLKDFDPIQVKCAIMNGADPKQNMYDKLVSGGTLNIEGAIQNFSNCAKGTVPPGNGHTNTKGFGADQSAQQFYHEKEGNTLNPELLVYPNPVGQDLNIEFNLNTSGGVNVSVMNTSGRQLMNTISKGEIGKNYIKLNFDKVNNNKFLIVRIQTNEFTKFVKLSTI